MARLSKTALVALGGLACTNAIPAGRAQESSLSLKSVDVSADEPALAHVTGKPEVLYAVVTSRAHHGDKAKSVLDTWCSDIYACAFFSDAINPSNEPTTYELSLKEHGIKAEDNLDHTVEHQLRHVAALKKARELVLSQSHADKLGSVKWVVLCTDDSYFFHQNLVDMLGAMNSSAPVYTGSLIPGTEDEEGNGIVNIGGGAVFSRAALSQMTNLHNCIADARPGGKWWGLTPDSIVGECAYDAGVPTEAPDHSGAFNQLGCTAVEGHAVHHCAAHNELTDATAKAAAESDGESHETAEGVDQCSCAGEWQKPVSFHPIVERESMQMLWTTFTGSSAASVHNVSLVKLPGLQLNEMTPDQKHWFFRGYDDGVVAGKQAGWTEAQAMRREGRREGESLGRVKGKEKGKNIGYRQGKAKGMAIGEHRGREQGVREGERAADEKHAEETKEKSKNEKTDEASSEDSESKKTDADAVDSSSSSSAPSESTAPTAKATKKGRKARQ